jgi:hypothetical protein
MKSIMALALSFAFALAVVAFGLVLAGHHESKSKQPGNIFERDFSGVIIRCKTYDNPFDLNWKHANSSAGLNKLQDMQINGWQAPNGEHPDLFGVFMMYQQFSRQQGRPPKDGAELYLFLLAMEKRASTGLETVRVTKLPGGTFELVNPQTGRFYGAFDGLTPEPGGLEFHRITDADDALRAFAGRPGGEGFTKMDIGYELIVRGSDGRTRLDTACVKQSLSGPPGGPIVPGQVLHRGQPTQKPED